MDADIKQYFDDGLSRIEHKIDTGTAETNRRFDNIEKWLEKIEKTHDSDHDKLIKLESQIEQNAIDLSQHKADDKEWGKAMSKRLDVIERNNFRQTIAIVALSLASGAGLTKIIQMVLP